MSKSADNKKGSIFLLDDVELTRKKIMGATTDSEMVIKYDMENKPGISNLINIYTSLNGKSISEVEQEFEGKNYGEFKTYHCTIPEFVKQKGISTNKMYSLIKSGLLEKSKPEVRRSKPKRSDKARKRILKEYVIQCAEKGVPIEIDI